MNFATMMYIFVSVILFNLKKVAMFQLAVTVYRPNRNFYLTTILTTSDADLDLFKLLLAIQYLYFHLSELKITVQILKVKTA